MWCLLNIFIAKHMLIFSYKRERYHYAREYENSTCGNIVGSIPYEKFCLFAKFVRRQLNENCDHRRVGAGRSICCAIIFKTVFERLLLQICTIRRSK